MRICKPNVDLLAEYTADETAHLLGISASSLRKHTSQGDIKKINDSYLGVSIVKFWKKRMTQIEKLIKSKHTYKDLEEVNELMFEPVVSYYEDAIRSARVIADRIGLDKDENWIHAECEEQLDEIIELAKTPSVAWADADNDLREEFESAYEQMHPADTKHYEEFLERVANDIAEAYSDTILNKMTTAYMRGY